MTNVVTLVKDVDNGAWYACVGAELYRKYLYLPLNFVASPNCSKK